MQEQEADDLCNQATDRSCLQLESEHLISFKRIQFSL